MVGVRLPTRHRLRNEWNRGYPAPMAAPSSEAGWHRLVFATRGAPYHARPGRQPQFD